MTKCPKVLDFIHTNCDKHPFKGFIEGNKTIPTFTEINM